MTRSHQFKSEKHITHALLINSPYHLPASITLFYRNDIKDETMLHSIVIICGSLNLNQLEKQII
ncbi:MAG TPA: hypothetical protein ENJ08_12490 [Gammaproteobacteria bacterium]|nr:hypothetical protein [Gammaproteobacteria bacterium]